MLAAARPALRRHAWQDLKKAVRAYVQEPTDDKARQVEDAWAYIRRMRGVTAWRRPAPRRADVVASIVRRGKPPSA